MVSSGGEWRFTRELAMGFWSCVSGGVLLEKWPWESGETSMGERSESSHGREEREI